jgi:hypothetical protein
MRHKNKFFVAIFLFLLLLPLSRANLGSEHNVWGWAWVETIGWVNFNCNSKIKIGASEEVIKVCKGGPDKGKICNSGFSEASSCPSCAFVPCCVPACDLVNYGVHINPETGVLSGFAWSENIGWITFDRSIAGPPPQNPYLNETFLAKVEPKISGTQVSYEFSGWARAISGCDCVDGAGNPCDWTASSLPSGAHCSSSNSCQTCGGWDGWISLRRP